MKNKTLRGFFLTAFIISFMLAIFVNIFFINIYSRIAFNYRRESIDKIITIVKNYTNKSNDVKVLFNEFIQKLDLVNSTIGILDQDKNLIISNKPIENNNFDNLNFKNINFDKSNFLEFTLYNFRPEPPVNPSVKQERYIYFPFYNNNNKYFLIINFEPDKTVGLFLNRDTMLLISMIISIIMFLVVFYLITNKKIAYINKISKEISKISFGQLKYKIEIKGKDEISEIAKNINLMAEEINNQIEKERNIEKEKYELISNISHDLRTPLTSIIGYLNLIKESNYKNKEELVEYSKIAHKKSIKIKELVDDLFEFTKYNNKDIKIFKMEVNLNDFIEQFIYEMSDYETKYGKKISKILPSKGIFIKLDPQLYFRVFENLTINAFKYSKKESNLNIKLYRNHNEVNIEFSNKIDKNINLDTEKIFTRFYKYDKSRNTYLGGSGLGLSIVKSIINLHEHKINAEIIGDEIIFKIKIN